MAKFEFGTEVCQEILVNPIYVIKVISIGCYLVIHDYSTNYPHSTKQRNVRNLIVAIRQNQGILQEILLVAEPPYKSPLTVRPSTLIQKSCDHNSS